MVPRSVGAARRQIVTEPDNRVGIVRGARHGPGRGERGLEAMEEATRPARVTETGRASRRPGSRSKREWDRVVSPVRQKTDYRTITSVSEMVELQVATVVNAFSYTSLL